MVNMKAKMKRTLLIAALASASAAFAAAPKNVILFIGDGMSVPQRMVADEFARATLGRPLAMNSMKFAATTRTSSASSLVTDSAAAATAIACGVKTYNSAIGVGPDRERVESCAEFAKARGRKVGIVSTVTITHATPAGFYAHQGSRGQTYGIALDLAKSGFDLFAGGGLDLTYNDTKAAGYVGDAYDNAVSNGYAIVRTRDDFLALKPGCGKILTRFSDIALKSAIDAEGSGEPTIAELTRKAVELLEGESGFFLMVEGGRIDWAGHANDAATNLRDVLALDEAVAFALEYQAAHAEDTLVIVTGDHETGGMSMGFAGTGYALYVDRLAHQKCGVGRFDDMVAERFKANNDLDYDRDLKPMITEWFGLRFSDSGPDDPMRLHKDERAEVRRAAEHDLAFLRSKVGKEPNFKGEKRHHLGDQLKIQLSHKAGIGWSSGVHTAMPVLTTATGPGGERFTGFIDNTDISKAIKTFCE